MRPVQTETATGVKDIPQVASYIFRLVQDTSIRNFSYQAELHQIILKEGIVKENHLEQKVLSDNQIQFRFVDSNHSVKKAFVISNPLNKVYEVFDHEDKPSKHLIRIPEEYITIRINHTENFDQIWVSFSEATDKIIKIDLNTH